MGLVQGPSAAGTGGRWRTQERASSAGACVVDGRRGDEVGVEIDESEELNDHLKIPQPVSGCSAGQREAYRSLLFYTCIQLILSYVIFCA